MNKHFLASYAKLLIKTCHKRGAYAMGGMAAQIPIKDDPEANAMALDKVRADKIREVMLGHDGTWVAHPGLVPLAREAFSQHMIGDEQLYRLREDVQVTREDLLQVPEGTITSEGLRTNINVGIQYLATWLSGTGCVPLYNLMEDAATAEISRTQLWQWLYHGAQLDDGRRVTKERVETTVQKVMAGIRKEVGEERYALGNYETARDLFFKVAIERELPSFLTLPAYEHLVEQKR
jgi:malate synthase